jgi:hypothetical protein
MTDDEKAAKKSASKKALKEKKEETKRVEKPAVEKKEMKSVSKKTEKPAEKKEMKSASKKTEDKKTEKTPKASPKKSPAGDVFSGPAKAITENVEYWKCKKINLDENTEGRRWKYHPETGLCFENDDTYTLVARYVDNDLTWLSNLPDRIKNWAVKSGCKLPQEEEDIELEGEFSEEE